MWTLPELEGADTLCREPVEEASPIVADERERERRRAFRESAEVARQPCTEPLRQVREVSPASGGDVLAHEARDCTAGERGGRNLRITERDVVVAAPSSGKAETTDGTAQRRDAGRHPERVLAEECDQAERRPTGDPNERRPADDGGAVGQTERLVQAGEREIGMRAERLALGRRKPRLRGILDQEEAALVAPPSPAATVLREAEIVDQMQ